MRTSTTSIPRLSGLAIDALVDAQHQLGALVAHDWLERRLAQNLTNRRIEQHRQALVGNRDRADRLEEAQRIDDPVTAERVDDEPLLVRRDDFKRRRIEIENALVEDFDIVDQWQLGVEAGRQDDPNRLAEAKHQSLLGLAGRRRALR